MSALVMDSMELYPNEVPLISTSLKINNMYSGMNFHELEVTSPASEKLSSDP